LRARLLPTHDPTVARAKPFEVNAERLAARADDHEIDRRMVAERERDLKTPAIASRFAPDPLLEDSATL